MRKSFSAAVVISLAGAAWVVGATGKKVPASSQPAASQPVAASPAATPRKDAAPKDWLAVTNAAGEFEFSVPKKWGPGQIGDQSDSFTLPPPPTPKAPANPPANAPTISLNLKPSTFTVKIEKGKATTLKAAADSVRATIDTDTEGTKIITDKAIDLDGKPAWLLESEERYVGGTVTNHTKDKPDVTHDMKRTLGTYRIVSVVDGNLYDVTFVSDKAHYAGGLDNVKKVMETFAFTGPAAEAGK